MMNKFILPTKKRSSNKRISNFVEKNDINVSNKNVITFSQKEKKEKIKISSVTSKVYCKFIHSQGIELDVFDSFGTIISTVRLFDSDSMSSFIPGWSLVVNKVHNKIGKIKDLDHEMTQIKIVSFNDQDSDIDIQIPEELCSKLTELDFGYFGSIYNGRLNENYHGGPVEDEILLGVVRFSKSRSSPSSHVMMSDNPMFEERRPYSISSDSSIL
jgi:hypothetical protein